MSQNKKKRVILISDIHCEADDPFAIMQHLLTPSFDVKGIVACHFEMVARRKEAMLLEHPELAGRIGAVPDFLKNLFPARDCSMQSSYEEGQMLLNLAGIDDVPLLHGSVRELGEGELPESEGADFIIREAMKEEPAPLYVCTLGAQTDLAIAYLKCPEIAERLTAVCILGGAYPCGGQEFNVMQDIKAANILLESNMPYWQIPANVYSCCELSFAELVSQIRPCGELGSWLVRQMFEYYAGMSAVAPGNFPNAEVWSIGDNPTAGVLLQSADRICWHEAPAPHVNDDGSYVINPNARKIRVYDSFDRRLTIHDLIAKIQLCYRGF